MFSHLVRALVVVAVGTSLMVEVLACSPTQVRKSKKTDGGEEFFEDEYAYEEGESDPEETIPVTSKDAGKITVPTRPDGSISVDGGPTCDPVPGPGDLQIVEMMISSKSGSSDYGEWVEIQNARNCAAFVKGVTVTSPRGGQGPNVATVTDDLVIPPWGTFLAVNDLDAAKNGHLTGPMISWQQTDVLKNDTDAVIVALGGVTLEEVTYSTGDPDVNLPLAGQSYVFPAGCLGKDRDDWRFWQHGTNQYDDTPTVVKGTPNAPNADVGCTSP